MRAMPVLILNSAGEWLFESVQHEWRKAILSTCRAMCGNSSDTHAPHWPCCANLNGDFISGPTWSVKKPVFLSKPLQLLAVALVQLGLVVPGIDLATARRS